MSVVWHYTILDRLKQILADREIKPATAHIEPNERPAVWFSSNPLWEQTANKAPTKEEMIEKHGAVLVRIAVAKETAPNDWPAYLSLSGVSQRLADGMRISGEKAGASIDEWFVCFGSVPQEKWLAIEVWDPKAKEWIDPL